MDEHEMADLDECATADLVTSFRAGGICGHSFLGEMTARGLEAEAREWIERTDRTERVST